MATSFLFEQSFTIAGSFLSWASATTGAGSFQGINDPNLLHYVAVSSITGPDDEVVIPVSMFAGQTITVDVDFGAAGGDDPVDLEAWVIDADGNFVSQDDSGTLDPGSTSVLDPNFSFTATETGVYFIALSQWLNNYIGDFEFENDGGDVGTFQVDIATANSFGFINFGTNDDDTLDFSFDDLDDRISAKDGNDFINTGGGRNVVDAGDGIDTVIGGSGSDQVFGDLGNDSLVGNAGDDVLIGSSGDDTMRGGAGNDSLVGGAGIDLVDYSDAGARVVVDLRITLSQNTQGAGTDIVRGVEHLTGSAFDDILTGSGRGNILIGGAGRDVMSGNNGEDLLVGGAGRDQMSGGAGSDTFRFDAVSDLGIGTARDVIVDFVHQTDVVNLRAVDANSVRAGNQEFTFIGGALFSGVAGQLRVGAAGANTFVAMDLNGDRVADIGILFNGNILLTAGDFLL